MSGAYILDGPGCDLDHNIGVVRESVTPIALEVDMPIFSVHRLNATCG